MLGDIIPEARVTSAGIRIQQLLPRCHRIKPPLNEEAAERVEKVLMRGDIAALIMEPIICNLGVLIPEDGFMREIARLCRSHGTLVLNARLRDRFALAARPTLSFGAGAGDVDADVRAGAPRWESGRLRFRLTHRGDDHGEAALRVPGEHNAWNAAANVWTAWSTNCAAGRPQSR